MEVRAMEVAIAGEQGRLKKTTRTHNELSAQLRRDATNEEVAERLGWTVEEVRDIKDAMTDTTSLNHPSGADKDGSELGEFVEDERTSDAAGEVIGEMERSFLQEAIQRLPERYRHVLIRRYGLDESKPATLVELGEELEVSRERVRQFQREAEHVLKIRMLATGGARSTL